MQLNKCHLYFLNNKDLIKNKIQIVKRELEILKKLDHPNIVKFYETYQDEKYLYFVMEYCSGGELFNQIIKRKHFSEHDAC